MMTFHKYTAIGNDYLILDARHYALPVKDIIIRTCDRHFGIGSDGLLWGGMEEKGCFPLKIFNPDGSEAEKSGNGIRIFARFLWDNHYSQASSLTVRVSSGDVLCSHHENCFDIATAMGIPQWDTEQLPSPCDQTLLLDGQLLKIHAVSMGNPHVVIIGSSVVALDDILRYGPLLECHPLFPNRTNVQMIYLRDRRHIDMKIWERGVGHTLASGSSACAAFAVARKLGLCDDVVAIHMPGGDLAMWQDADGVLHQTGQVLRIADCQCYCSSFLEEQKKGRPQATL
jgi:diaminopimelate epimerase